MTRVGTEERRRKGRLKLLRVVRVRPPHHPAWRRAEIKRRHPKKTGRLQKQPPRKYSCHL